MESRPFHQAVSKLRTYRPLLFPHDGIDKPLAVKMSDANGGINARCRLAK